MVRELLRRLGAAKTSLIITVVSILCSVFLYMIIYNVVGGVTAVGIFVSIIIPAIVTPLLSYFLLRLLIKLDLAEEALAEVNNELELRVRQRTAELVKANEELLAEITERKRAEEQLRRTNEELKNLVYFVSHDLKSPIMTIQGFAPHWWPERS